jgi:hypothetical protein
MSRVVNLRLTAEQVSQHCREAKINISMLEALPEGGVRLVCSTSEGSDQIRAELDKRIIPGEPRRRASRPTRPLW